MPELSVNDKIPAFELKDQNGEMVSSDALIGDNHLILFFYPKADTAGCTKEACSFRDEFADFQKADARVVGISSDSPQAQKAWAEKNGLPFTLLADEGGKVRKQFGVKGNLFGLIPGRTTYVIDKTGTIRHIFSSQMNFEKHVTEALEALAKL
jgi:peroxiredoxin Q/BCP